MDNRMKGKIDAAETIYISPKELAVRWRVGLTSAYRYAKEAGFSIFMVGNKRNGCIRYKLSEVIQYESKRTV